MKINDIVFGIYKHKKTSMDLDQDTLKLNEKKGITQGVLLSIENGCYQVGMTVCESIFKTEQEAREQLNK